MNLQKDNRITRQKWKQHTESEDSPWTLKRAMTISKTGSQNASIATSMGIWSKNVGIKRRRKKPEC